MYQQKTLQLAHFTIIRDTIFLRIFQSLNCNNFGSNKGIVIKLSYVFFFFLSAYNRAAYYISRNDHRVWRGRLVSRPSVTVLVCNVGPCPKAKVHFVTVTKSQVINFD